MHYKVAAFFHLKPPEGTPTPKWMARRALKTARQCDQRTCESVSSFCEAVLSGKLPQYYFSELKRFKSYSDALPSEGLVGEWHPDYPNMKCKGNTIIGISLTLQATADEGLIKSEYVLNAIERYKLQDWSFHKGKYISRTTPEEIKLINDTLDTVMGYLESEYGLEPQKRWVPYRAGQGEPYTVGEAKSILERLRPASDDDVRPFGAAYEQ